MKIYDISQEVFSCVVYPGDPTPKRNILKSMDDKEKYNLSKISMCVHNGTHIDAPRHFIKDGKTVDKMPLNSFVGLAYVVEFNGKLTDKDAKNILNKASKVNKEAAKRILIKGDAEVTLEAAKVFAKAKILLLGNESISVGPINSPMEVHVELLKEDIVLLEGIRLNEVSEGIYLLNAAPLNLANTEGSPCRALLIENY